MERDRAAKKDVVDLEPVQQRSVAPGKNPRMMAAHRPSAKPNSSDQSSTAPSSGSFLGPLLDGVEARHVQAKSQNLASDTARVQVVAQEGVTGSGQSLPYLQQIQKSFGAHDVTGVRAHVGGKAEEAAGEIGALAYATGNNVAFAGQPDLHTAAHEAAHIVQQRAGVHLKGGVGQEGDQYEQHADAVADLVVQGKSAEVVLSEMTGGGNAPAGLVQRKPGDAVRRPKHKDVSGDGVRDASSLGFGEIRCGEEGDDQSACFLSANTRDAVRQKLTIRLAFVGDTFAGVINETRIKDALKPKGGVLGIAVDLLYVFARSAAPQFAAAISTMKKTVDLGGYGSYEDIERVFSSRVEKLMTSAFVAGTRRARSELQSMASAVESANVTKREKFLDGLEGKLKVQLDQMHTEAIASMGDAQLIAFTAYWDQAVHTAERYRGELARLLAANKRVEDIGTHPNYLRVVEGPDGRRRLAHCKTHGGGLGFVAWVDERLLEKAVSNNRKTRHRSHDMFTGVTTIRHDDPQFVMVDSRNRRKGLATDDPRMKKWLEESTPVYEEERYHPDTGKVTGGGVRQPDSFDQVKSNNLNVGPFDES